MNYVDRYVEDIFRKITPEAREYIETLGVSNDWIMDKTIQQFMLTYPTKTFFKD